MREKYNYKKELIVKEKINTPEVNRQINELKNEFKKYTSGRVGELYRILNKIVELKRIANKRYAPRSLEWENGLNLNAVQIRYIFSYKYFSDKSKQLIDEGAIEDRTICFLIWRFGFLREAGYQDKLVNMYLNGKIKISELGWMNSNEIKELINSGKLLLEKDRYLISSNKSICSILSRLKQRGVFTSNSKYKQELLNSINNLKEYLLKKDE